MSVRIVLADDHRILRDGLAVLLENQPDLEVVGQAADGREAVQVAVDTRPDVVVMDLWMPVLNGIEATRRLLAEMPKVKILCLSLHSDKRWVLAVLEAGASGYLLKDCAFEELARAIRTVTANQTYLSPGIAGAVVEGYKANLAKTKPSRSSLLTGREREVARLLAEGMTAKEIAVRLRLSVKTVGTHREHLMAKLQIHSLAELTKYAIREGLTSLETKVERVT